MFWWQYFLSAGIFVFIVFVMLVVFAFALFIRSTIVNPTIEAWFIDNNKKVTREILDTTGMFESEWKLESINQTKVKFKVKPKGLGKSKEMEWNNKDYYELETATGQKCIIFGLANFNFHVATQMGHLKTMLDSALAKQAIIQQEYNHLYNNYENRVDARIKQIKEFSPIVVSAKAPQKSGGFSR